MKLFKLYILIVIVCLFVGVGNAYNHKLEDFEINEVSYEEENKEEIEEELTSEVVEEPKESKQEDKQETKTAPKKESNSSVSKNETKTNQPKADTKTETKPKEEPKNNSSESGVVDPNGNNIPEEHNIVIDKKPWEKAGVSEYDWYHKPVHSWMRVDYSVHTCGTVQNCEALCMNDAEELSYTENVSCIQVYTYSGSYLGEMLKRQ